MSRKLTVLFLIAIVVLLMNVAPAMALYTPPSNGGENPLFQGSGMSGTNAVQSNPIYEAAGTSLWGYDNLQTVQNNPLFQGSGNSGTNPLNP